MLIQKQIYFRTVVGVLFVLASLALGASSLMSAYAGSPDPWTIYLSYGIAFTCGVYLIKSARQLHGRLKAKSLGRN